MTNIIGIIEDSSMKIAVEIKGSGPKGDPGEDGYTPVKGVDYFDGSDANVTNANVVNALGYIPLSEDSLPSNLETTTGSQAKANQAEQNAKDYTDQEISSIDIPDSTWESIQNKPDTFVPSEHNHTIGNITGLQNELNSKETPSGSQTKADAAENNAKSYVDDKVLTDVPTNAKFTDTIVDISGKQDKLTAGDNIIITNNTISATDTVYDDTAVQAELGKKADKTYVDNKVKTDVPSGAKFTDTVYTHPANHPASMITESSTKRFVSDGEKSTWNSKSDTDTVTTINGKTGAISKDDIVALGIPSQDTNTTYSEITTAEIDTGTASTLRTITGRRLKYLLDKIVALFPTKTSELTNDSGFLTSVTKSDAGLSNVDNIKQMPISGGVLENYREKLVTLSGTSTAINLSLGNVFTHTLSGNTTYSITNAVSGQAHSFTLIITQTETVRTITFPASVKWQGGEIPDLSGASKTYVLTFLSIDGGTTWLGMFGGEF